MNKFIKIISMLVVFSMLMVGSIVKAEGSIHWDEEALRASVHSCVTCALRRAASSSALSLALIDSGYRRVDEACAGLCETRIELLKRILKNEILLPIDVESYLYNGFVETDSDEAANLWKILSTLHDRKGWKPNIDRLIEIYESIKWGYENSCLYHLINTSWDY